MVCWALGCFIPGFILWQPARADVRIDLSTTSTMYNKCEGGALTYLLTVRTLNCLTEVPRYENVFRGLQNPEPTQAGCVIALAGFKFLSPSPRGETLWRVDGSRTRSCCDHAGSAEIQCTYTECHTNACCNLMPKRCLT